MDQLVKRKVSYRRYISRRSTDGVNGLLDLHRKSKVSQLDAYSVVFSSHHQKIFRLQIPMHNILRMQVEQGFAQVLHHARGVPLVELDCLSNGVEQITALLIWKI